MTIGGDKLKTFSKYAAWLSGSGHSPVGIMKALPANSRKRRSSTLAEVARAAEVSIATVSRVLNGGNKEVWEGSAARAENIRKVARKLGYRPDFRARALRASQTNSIGVVYSQSWPMMDMASYMQMFRAFGDVLEAAGYHMMFVHVPRTTGVLPASILQSVDAAVFYHAINDGEIEAAQVVRGPAIQINCEPKLPIPLVAPDEVGGATLLAKHLLGFGHRRIAFLDPGWTGTDFDHHSRGIREAVFRQVMAEAGLSSGFLPWREALNTPLSEMVAHFKALPPEARPTAVVIPYSIMAVSLMNEFLRQGVRVPEQLSIVTFDDHELVAHSMVPMTTVAVPMEEVGRTSAGLILGLLRNGKSRARESIILPERLVIRRSVGPAAS